ncbi:MAG: hypothetical protein AAFW83_09050 [Pseudomonadota bacterium]
MPNNFPSDGAHNTVTREAVDEIASQTPTQNASLDYTIGGRTEASVHSNVEVERMAAVINGERTLNRAGDDINSQWVNTQEGYATASFNDQNRQERVSPYLRELEEARTQYRAVTNTAKSEAENNREATHPQPRKEDYERT